MPVLLLQERFFAYARKFRTSLHIAIKSRNPEAVTTILTHPLFVAQRSYDVEADCSRLIRSYMWALLWYYETRDEEKLMALRPSRNLPADILKTKAKELLTSQEKILAMLLESCKASMRHARLQGKHGLPEDIIQMCVVDGVVGEGHWQHPYGFDLLNIQKDKAKEICSAFFTEEELRQTDEHAQQQGNEPERVPYTSYIGSALVVGLAGVVLWKFINRDSEQGCVIS